MTKITLTSLRMLALELVGELEDIAATIEEDLQANSKVPSEVRKLRQIAANVRKWMSDTPNDDELFPDLALEVRNGIAIKAELGLQFNDLLRRLRFKVCYKHYNNNADLAKPLEEIRDKLLGQIKEFRDSRRPRQPASGSEKADLAEKQEEPDSQRGKFGFHPKAKEPNES